MSDEINALGFKIPKTMADLETRPAPQTLTQGELLPCPFCGSDEILKGKYSMFCGNCNAESSHVSDKDNDLEDFYQRWNTRATPDIYALYLAITFFASVIKSGEPWTSQCQSIYDEAMRANFSAGSE